MSDDRYKPTEHGGLREDGQPDRRVGTGEFAYGKVDPHEAGEKGGKLSGIGSSDDNNTSGRSGNSGSSGRSGGSQKGQFAHGKVDPHEAGRKGGHAAHERND
ncbi:uncharacterized protein B0I36DRAFT_352626 [Microdochium trichocladiopsis]|uniref:Stress-induced acidophilic repeat motif-containing protein n=1 Tax=Microdochium trichocladiopsis TaxID=1682393 RepID=A0A9P9BLH3_9PEZI|nr:uncharacterized protein B0I36DRAFT_352626 [Microdochium trichocladiopsis]KAH7024385.1 hypothetical protein B0I36DRAFT_352626 [Microdochium trichocladiopsis]